MELDKLRQGGGPRPGTTAAWAALEQAVIGKAVDLLSGPGGLASFLRRRELGVRVGGPSLPLDIGYARRSRRQPQRGAAAGPYRRSGCGGTQPACACQVHHTTHKANGGKTSVKDCVLLCPFHHQIVIHRWGWTLVVNPDGTTSAWNKNKTKVLHSHERPARAGKGPACPGSSTTPSADPGDPRSHHPGDGLHLDLQIGVVKGCLSGDIL